jgi:histidyl-tRNA synthetase
VLLGGAPPRAAAAEVDAYVVHAGDAAGRLAREAAEALRDAGFAVAVHAGAGGFKSQMKRADASGAAYALIVGDDEAARGAVAVKPLRGGEQFEVPAAEVAARFAAVARSAGNATTIAPAR